MFCRAPKLVSLEILFVNNSPSERFIFAVLAPLLLRIVRVEVDAC